MIRRLQLLGLGAGVALAAFSTGLPFLFFLLWTALLVGGGSWALTRLGLADLEAGYAVDRLAGHAGDPVRVTCTVRNTGRVPKPWLEVRNPTTLPGGLPGRAVGLGPRSERSWAIHTTLRRRGVFRIEPLELRTGDPFGFFEAQAAVGRAANVVVYPRLEALPGWRLPPATVEGARSAPERTLQTTPLAAAVRPYAPGDAINRIHWRSTARRGEIQVKEFELERTADAWLLLDLDAAVAAGEGEESTTETAVRVAASIADRALAEHRSVGLAVNVAHRVLLPPDRDARQRLRILQILAAVEADGTVPAVEPLLLVLERLRRGMTLVLVTASDDPDIVRPLATLRARGIAAVVVLVDGPAHAAAAGLPADPAGAQRLRALRHALAEHEIRSHLVPPGVPLAEVLVS